MLKSMEELEDFVEDRLAEIAEAVAQSDLRVDIEIEITITKLNPEDKFIHIFPHIGKDNRSDRKNH